MGSGTRRVLHVCDSRSRTLQTPATSQIDKTVRASLVSMAGRSNQPVSPMNDVRFPVPHPKVQVFLPQPAAHRARMTGGGDPGFWLRLWRRLRHSERDAYFAGASDLADLERRMRAWDDRCVDASMSRLRFWR